MITDERQNQIAHKSVKGLDQAIAAFEKAVLLREDFPEKYKLTLDEMLRLLKDLKEEIAEYNAIGRKLAGLDTAGLGKPV